MRSCPGVLTETRTEVNKAEKYSVPLEIRDSL